MVHTYGRLAGRGNLRENREDPAPTVGIVGRTLRPLPPMNDAARLGTRRLVRAALGGGRATLGPPLQHRPYRERNSQSRKLIEMGLSVEKSSAFITMRHAASFSSSTPFPIDACDGVNVGRRRVVILPFAIPIDSPRGRK